MPRERAGGHRVGVSQCSGSNHLTVSFDIKDIVHSSAAVAVAVPLPTGSSGRAGGHRVGVRDSPAAQRASERSERASEQPGTWVRCGRGRGPYPVLRRGPVMRRPISGGRGGFEGVFK